MEKLQSDIAIQTISRNSLGLFSILPQKKWNVC